MPGQTGRRLDQGSRLALSGTGIPPQLLASFLSAVIVFLDGAEFQVQGLECSFAVKGTVLGFPV